MKTRQFGALLVFALLVFGVEPAQAQRMKTDHQIAYYQTLLKRSPQSAKAYLGLGDALVRKARETGELEAVLAQAREVGRARCDPDAVRARGKRRVAHRPASSCGGTWSRRVWGSPGSLAARATALLSS